MQWVNIPALLAIVLWGGLYALAKIGLQEFLLLTYSALGMVLAALLLLICLWYIERNIRIPRKDFQSIFLLGFFGNGLSQLSFMAGLHYTSASNSALIVAISPQLTALLAWGLGQERVPASRFIGIGFSLIGVGLLLQDSWQIRGSAHLLGDLLILGTALLWSLYSLFSVPLLERHGSLKITTHTTLIGTIPLLVVSWPKLFQQDWGVISLIGWLTLGYRVVFGMVIAMLCWLRAIREIGPSRAMVYTYLEPLVGIGFALLLLQEELTLSQIIGALIILLGVMLGGR